MIWLQWLSIVVGFMNVIMFFYIQVDRILRIEKKKEYLKKKREMYKCFSKKDDR